MRIKGEINLVYHIIRLAVKLWLNIRFKIKIEGAENIPKTGCLLAMNHRSNYDPLLVGVYTPRKMHIMAKEELFKKRFYAWVISEMGAFPIKRGSADLKSIKHSLKLIKNGEIFSIFIEGTRSKIDEMQDPKKGIGFLVAKSAAPVVPVYIYGLKNKWFSKAGVRFGEPSTFEGDNYEEIAEKVANNIKQLSFKS
jgi:1-acyl-sn-glycerol-3-phosphate acyltransferase